MSSTPITISTDITQDKKSIPNPDCKTKKIKWSRAAFALEDKNAPMGWYKFPGTFINTTLQDKMDDEVSGGTRIVYYKYKKFEDAIAAAKNFPLNRCLGFVKTRDNYQLRIGRPGKYTWQGEDLAIAASNQVLKTSPERAWGTEVSYIRIDPYNQDHFSTMKDAWAKRGDDITHTEFVDKHPFPLTMTIPKKKKKKVFKRKNKITEPAAAAAAGPPAEGIESLSPK
jgi:hypothetical protein